MPPEDPEDQQKDLTGPATTLIASEKPTTSDQHDTHNIPPKLPTFQDRLRPVVDSVLRFVGNASNETLGACAVGLAASTYLVLGRLGLVLIGAFGGAILSTTWAHIGHDESDDTDDRTRRKREAGVEVARRLLDIRSKSTQEEQSELSKIEASTTQKQLDFSAYPNKTASALSSFTDAVIQDFVKWWYSPILPAEEAFPGDCRQILVAFIHSFSNHVSRKRAADPFLDFIANSTSVIIVFLQELAVALKASQRAEVEEALSTYLHFQPDSNLANVLNKDQQKQKLHMVADDILQNFLDSKTYNCLPARTFLREVLAGLILDGTLISCSKPERINGWIVYLLEESEPALLDAIDAGVEELEQRASATGAPVEDVARKSQHQRRVSRAEQAMSDAVAEAQRMNAMIAEEQASRSQRQLPQLDSEDTLSTTATTDTGLATPTSSDEERQNRPNRVASNRMVFDNEGNAIPSVTPSPAKPKSPNSGFTSFDQLEQTQSPGAMLPTSQAPARAEMMVAVPLTLHNASINIIDLGMNNPQVPMRQKPDGDMMIQIEPASSRFPGWIVTRQYVVFEPLHETLRRIANISGVPEFNIEWPELPSWRGKSRERLITNLEQYLRSALKSERLAESEAMKRFLEKETGLEKVPASQKNVFVQAGTGLETVGKGFVNVLGQGGKGLQTGFQTGGKVFQTGGKAVLGGVTGVFGTVTSGIGPKRPGLSTSNSSASIQKPHLAPLQAVRQSQDSIRPSAEYQQVKPMTSARTSLDQPRASQDMNRAQPQEDEFMNLPPPPDMMTEADEAAFSPTRGRTATISTSHPTTPKSVSRMSTMSTSQTEPPRPSIEAPTSKPQPERTQDVPISEEETRMTVELVFALITELLSLSSAWTFRLSLLTAAKSYLLRPNNPQLRSIRTLLQESVIDANTSDEGIAAHIRKLRENALPTEDELKNWPKEPSDEEKEKLRIKARKLLVEKGMPQALTTVVGVAASGEALGKVFDCLQNRDVARGLIFALMLQALRTVIQ